MPVAHRLCSAAVKASSGRWAAGAEVSLPHARHAEGPGGWPNDEPSPAQAGAAEGPRVGPSELLLAQAGFAVGGRVGPNEPSLPHAEGMWVRPDTSLPQAGFPGKVGVGLVADPQAVCPERLGVGPTVAPHAGYTGLSMGAGVTAETSFPQTGWPEGVEGPGLTAECSLPQVILSLTDLGEKGVERGWDSGADFGTGVAGAALAGQGEREVVWGWDSGTGLGTGKAGAVCSARAALLPATSG